MIPQSIIDRISLMSKKELIALHHLISRRILHLCEGVGCERCDNECSVRPAKSSSTEHEN